MPPTYLGRSHRHGVRERCGICEHLSPTHNLSQALTAGLPAQLSCWVELRRQASGCRRWIYFMWTSSAAAAFFIKTIRSPRSLCQPSTQPRPGHVNPRWRPHYEFRFFRPSKTACEQARVNHDLFPSLSFSRVSKTWKVSLLVPGASLHEFLSMI